MIHFNLDNQDNAEDLDDNDIESQKNNFMAYITAFLAALFE